RLGGRVDVDVAVAGEMLEDGDRRFADHGADQALAAAGDDQVDVPVELEQVRDEGPGGGIDQLPGSRVELRFFKRLGDELNDRLVGMEGCRAAAEDDRVAALEAECSCVAGDV